MLAFIFFMLTSLGNYSFLCKTLLSADLSESCASLSSVGLFWVYVASNSLILAPRLLVGQVCSMNKVNCCCKIAQPQF